MVVYAKEGQQGKSSAEGLWIAPKSVPFFVDSKGEQMVDYSIQPEVEVRPGALIFDN
jgi:hypothetical protein